jgi:hypothetical protein
MEYPCKTIPLTQLTLNRVGVAEPLCNTCKTRDCTNPIQTKKVSIFGVNKEMRLLTRGSEPTVVIDCPEGYTI